MKKYIIHKLNERDKKIQPNKRDAIYKSTIDIDTDAESRWTEANVTVGGSARLVNASVLNTSAPRMQCSEADEACLPAWFRHHRVFISSRVAWPRRPVTPGSRVTAPVQNGHGICHAMQWVTGLLQLYLQHVVLVSAGARSVSARARGDTAANSNHLSTAAHTQRLFTARAQTQLTSTEVTCSKST